MPFIAAPVASTLEPKEKAMYLSVFIVYAIILVFASPVIWVAWWLVADLAERATGSYRRPLSVTTPQLRRQAA